MVRGGRRPTLSRELQDGHQLLQGESEDLLDFRKRVTLRNALNDAGQRHPGSADNPDVAAFSRHALRRGTFGPIQLACLEEPVYRRCIGVGSAKQSLPRSKRGEKADPSTRTKVLARDDNSVDSG